MRRVVTALGTAAIGAMAAIAGVGAVGQNLSFEDGVGPLPHGSFIAVAGGNSTWIDGWLVGGNSVDIINGYWTASDGVRSLDLNGNAAGSVSQSFATIPGQPYRVTFDLSANPDLGSPDVHTIDVLATGATTASYSYDRADAGNTLADMKWATHTYVFIASAEETTLSFESTTFAASGPNWFGPALDNVQIDEAGTEVCKKGGWMSLADSEGTAFRNQGDCVSFIATGGRNLAAGQ